jgi:hypothetical protein
MAGTLSPWPSLPGSESTLVFISPAPTAEASPELPEQLLSDLGVAPGPSKRLYPAGHEAPKDRGGALSRVETRFVRGRDSAPSLCGVAYDVGSTTISAVMVGAWVLQTSL